REKRQRAKFMKGRIAWEDLDSLLNELVSLGVSRVVEGLPGLVEPVVRLVDGLVIRRWRRGISRRPSLIGIIPELRLRWKSISRLVACWRRNRRGIIESLGDCDGAALGKDKEWIVKNISVAGRGQGAARYPNGW